MLSVAPALPSERAAGLSLLLRQLPAIEREREIARQLDLAVRGDSLLDGLIVARDEGIIVGAILVHVTPDGTAFLWQPVLHARNPDESGMDALFAAARDWVDLSPAHLAQCLIAPEETKTRAALARNGFPHLTELQFLKRTFEEELSPRSAGELRSVGFTEPLQSRFVSVLSRTYLETLDCPGLSGVRTSEQALAGHRLAGEFSASRWRLFQAGESDVGLLLLTSHPEHRMWELIYMGIVPEMRGRGFGKEMLNEGLWMARDAGAEAIFLAVDTSNTYARAIYIDLGFVPLAVQAVHIRIPNRPAPT